MATNQTKMGAIAPGLRVGIDLVDVDLVREALDAHGGRYLRRVYTKREVDDCCSGDGRIAPERLAARFAAKEAVIKVLRPVDEHVPWRSIEVRRDASGWTGIGLTGAAARRADVCRVDDLALSLTHEGDHASAVVVAHIRSGGKEWR